ncbi:hypothetical protein DXG01_000007 [Tephrocybe rancida]|nr:hypothetical protein DXG01_000007 [Tephrocybe rancida]
MVSSNQVGGPLALVVALSAVSLTIGFHLGARGVSRKSLNESSAPVVAGDAVTIEEGEDEEEEDGEDIADGDLSSIQAGILEPCKLVLVVRTDLKMTQGKIAAQCGHATLACYKALIKSNPKLIKHWERTGQAKIALKGTSEEQILELEAIAKSLNLCARSIQDQGLTQVEEGTRTVLGIGPAPVGLINEVTGKLRLL